MWRRDGLSPFRYDVWDIGVLRAVMNDNLAVSLASLFAADTTPASPHDRDIDEPVSVHERLNRGQHRGGLGPVALEQPDLKWDPGCLGEHPDHDLRIQPGESAWAVSRSDDQSLALARGHLPDPGGWGGPL